MFSKEKTEPVPGRGNIIKKGYVHGYAKGAAIAIALLTAVGSVYVGAKIAPETDIPVALANGEIIMPPYYITVDGKRTALVKSKEVAEEIVGEVIEEYEGDPEGVIDIKVEETTGTEKMDIKTGDKCPDIMTVEEAKEKLSKLTVIVTKEETEIEEIEFEEKYAPTEELYIGETEIQTEGEEGIKEVTKKVVTANGEVVDTEIIEENIIKEPVQQVVLEGTKAGGNLTTPVPTVNISSPFGPRWGGFHSGVDFALPQGEPIYAACSGTVCYSGYSGGYGKLIKIDHGSGMQTCYAHCSSLLVSNGQHVEAGDTIGTVGSTGNSTGPHLHFEVIINGCRENPLNFLDL